jgi:hypothetical protein
LAVDGAGDLFVVGDGCHLTELPAGGGNLIGIATPGCVVALAFDGAGRLYQVDSGNNFVIGPFGSIAPTVDGKGLNGPAGLALDGEGDLFIADGGNNRIVKVPAGGGAATAMSPTVNGKGLNDPSAVAFDSAGDLFIADANNERVVEVPAGGGAATAIVDPGLGCPNGVAVDGAGDLFVSDPCGYVTEVPAGGGAPVNVSFSTQFFDLPGGGVAVDDAGDVFASFDAVATNPPPPGDPLLSWVLEVQASQQAPTLNFPTVTAVGSTDTADDTQTVEVLNLGNQALNLAALSYPADFPQASGDPNPCPVSISLGAGQSCDIPVEFAPEHSGALSEDVTFTENSLNVTGTKQSIAVSGTAVVVGEALTSPRPGSTLAGPSVTFTWTIGIGTTEYSLWLGLNGAGSSDLYNSGVATATSASVTGLPTKRATIYARLWYEVGGVWQHLDYTYTEATSALATMISPTQGATLSAPSATFTWNAGSTVTSYALWLGTGVGSSDLYDSGQTTATSVNVTGLPENGATIYARLFSEVGGEWQSIDYTYTEATGALATMTSPTSGSTLGTSNVTFIWSAGAGASNYALWLGTNGPGSSGLYNSGITALTTATVPSLPAKGVTVYARLYSDVDGQWKFIDYTYTEQ